MDFVFAMCIFIVLGFILVKIESEANKILKAMKELEKRLKELGGNNK